MGFASMFLYSQFIARIPYPDSDFSGQTIIVTGANTGLGLEAARHFVRLNAAKVILAVRNLDKGRAAAANIRNSTGAAESRLEVWQVDMSSSNSVKAFASRVQGLDRLDAVVLNAGIYTEIYRVAEDAESTITINVVNAVLLGLLVLPKLRDSARKHGTRGRLVFVGSDLQLIAQLKEEDISGSILDALNLKETANMKDRYKTSKLLLLYAVRSIAARSPVSAESNVIINYLTPGACKSDISRDPQGIKTFLFMHTVVPLVARSTEVGSRTYVDAAKPDIGEETHGAFLMDCKVTPNFENVEGSEGRKLQERFTAELFSKLEKIAPGVTKF